MTNDEDPALSHTETGRALTIADAARAAGTDRHSIRRKLHAGEFPNAFKDEQGFWRIHESDLLAAAVPLDGGAADGGTVVSEPARSEPSPPRARPEPPGEIERLRSEIIELRHRVATAEALLAAERRLSEELGRALQVARRTGDALLATVAGPQHDPRAREPQRAPAPAPPQPRVNWQAGLRAARAREAQLRAAREREEQQRAAAAPPGPEPEAEPEPQPEEPTTASGGDADSRASASPPEGAAPEG